MSTVMILAQQPLLQEEKTFWWVALGIGLVVIVVVIALLQLLLRFVVDIDRGVLGVWEMGKRVAANTATTWMLGTGQRGVTRRLWDLRDEALLHDELLSKGGKG